MNKQLQTPSFSEKGAGGKDMKGAECARAKRCAPLAGVQGPAVGPLVGSRGNAPVGVQGAKPPEAPGF